MRCMYYSRHPMKALVVSDIHSNLEALTAVIDDAGRNGGFDEVWALGDLVGYGPDPSACIELLRQHGADKRLEQRWAAGEAQAAEPLDRRCQQFVPPGQSVEWLKVEVGAKDAPHLCLKRLPL